MNKLHFLRHYSIKLGVGKQRAEHICVRGQQCMDDDDTVLGGTSWNPLPIPHRKIPELKGRDLDYVNVAYSHLIHSDWKKLNESSKSLTSLRVQHVLLKMGNDPGVTLDFYRWVQKQGVSNHVDTLETQCMVLHVLAKAERFKAAEILLKRMIGGNRVDISSSIFEGLLYTYRVCDSSKHVFDCLFKTYAHLKRFRSATNVFCSMKEYGFLPNVESCNAYISSLIDHERFDIGLRFYTEMRRCGISPNVYTLNMVICAYSKWGKLEKAAKMFEDMEGMNCTPNVVSYNTLIAGYCDRGLMTLAMKLKSTMGINECYPSIVTYNTLICGFCKQGKLHEANRVLNEMKAAGVAANTVTYNTLINGYAHVCNSEMAGRCFEEMQMNKVKANILTYNSLILCHCKEGKTKRAAHLFKELDNAGLAPNASTFHALITGQCVQKNSERAFLIYRTMNKSGCHPNADTFKMLVSTFCENEDFDGAVQVLIDMIGRNMSLEPSLLVEIFDGLISFKKVELARKLIKDMETRRILPKNFDKSKFVMLISENKKKSEGSDLL